MTWFVLAACAIIGMAVLVILYFKPYDYGGDSRRSGKLPLAGLDSTDESDDTIRKLVRIHTAPGACKCAVAMQNRIIAARDAPSLPLTDCDRQDCQCYYLSTEDRRSGADRRTSIDQLGRWLAGKQQDRRRGFGRRLADLRPLQI